MSKKLRFSELPIYKAIRGCKLSKRAQDEVLRKLRKYYPQFAWHISHATTLASCNLNWDNTKEGYEYWATMHRDSEL